MQGEVGGDAGTKYGVRSTKSTSGNAVLDAETFDCRSILFLPTFSYFVLPNSVLPTSYSVLLLRTPYLVLRTPYLEISLCTRLLLIRATGNLFCPPCASSPGFPPRCRHLALIAGGEQLLLTLFTVEGRRCRPPLKLAASLEMSKWPAAQYRYVKNHVRYANWGCRFSSGWATCTHRSSYDGPLVEHGCHWLVPISGPRKRGGSLGLHCKTAYSGAIRC